MGLCLRVGGGVHASIMCVSGGGRGGGECMGLCGRGSAWVYMYITCTCVAYSVYCIPVR